MSKWSNIQSASFTGEPHLPQTEGPSVWTDTELGLSVGCSPYHANIRNYLHFLLDHECKKSWKKSSKIQSWQVYYSGTSIWFLHWWVVCSNQQRSCNIQARTCV